MAMKSAFCCASLKTGTLIVGWLTLVGVILNVLSTVAIIAVQTTPPEEEDSREDMVLLDENRNWTKSEHPVPQEFDRSFTIYNHPYVNYGTAIVDIIVLVCLLYGTYKNRAALLLPFVGVFGIANAATGFLIIYWFSYYHFFFLLPLLVLVGISIYFVCIVWSYYLQLRDFEEDPKSQA